MGEGKIEFGEQSNLDISILLGAKKLNLFKKQGLQF